MAKEAFELGEGFQIIERNPPFPECNPGRHNYIMPITQKWKRIGRYSLEQDFD
jgi:hypothetical protein